MVRLECVVEGIADLGKCWRQKSLDLFVEVLRLIIFSKRYFVLDGSLPVVPEEVKMLTTCHCKVGLNT